MPFIARSLLAWLVLASVQSRSLTAQASIVVLVRHAEKAAPSGDPVLSAAGRERAEALVAALNSFPLEAIYVSEVQRTALTAAPLAAALHLIPSVVPVAGGVSGQAAATAAAIRRLPPGSAALVVGHSNTLGAIIHALGGPQVPELCDGEYATFFLLDLTAATPRLLRTRYGEPDPEGALDCQPG